MLTSIPKYRANTLAILVDLGTDKLSGLHWLSSVDGCINKLPGLQQLS